MRRHFAAQVIGVGDEIQHASREDILQQASNHQRSERCRRGGLDHHCVAGEQRWRQLKAHQDDREIPGDDRPDHAQRIIMGLNPARIIIGDHIDRQVERGEIAEEGSAAIDVLHRALHRLALFLHQHPGNLGAIGLNCLGCLDQQGLALGNRCRGPAREGGTGGSDSRVELRLGRARTGGDNHLGRRVDDVHGHVAIDHLATNQHLIVTHALLSLGPGFRPAISLCV
jgi:hypothetical protein